MCIFLPYKPHIQTSQYLLLRVPSSPALRSCSGPVRCCCLCWWPFSSQSTTPSTCDLGATRSTTTAHRATHTALRAGRARARSLSWRTAAYNHTDEGGRASTPNPSHLLKHPVLFPPQLNNTSCRSQSTLYKCGTGPTGS